MTINNNLLENHIYKNIFTKEDLDLIYSNIDLNDSNRTTIVDIYAQKTWFKDTPEKIKNIVTQKMNEIYGCSLQLEEISFSRYSKEYGDFPALTPHFDNNFSEQRLTLDIQLNSNIDWPIVVEGKSFTLKNNEALTFSGTHQVHWREQIEFKDGDFAEMLFCHFSLPEKKLITIEEKQETEKWLVYFSNRFCMKLFEENINLKNKIKEFNND